MITEFITQVKKRGLARSNRFSTIIPFPVGNSKVGNLSMLFCESASLPGISLSTTPQRINGESRELPYERIFDPVQLTFYVDADMTIKGAWDSWMDLIVNPYSRNIGYYRDYVKDILINVHTVDDDKPYSITLYEAYPKAIGAIQLDNNNKDIIKLSVTLSYKYWNATTTRITPDNAYDATGSDVIASGLQDPLSVYTGAGYEDFYFDDNTSVFDVGNNQSWFM